MNHEVDANLYRIETFKYPDMTWAEAVVRGTSQTEGSDFVGRRLEQDISAIRANGEDVAFVSPRPNEQGLYEIKVYEGSTRNDAHIVRLYYATQEQMDCGRAVGPVHGSMLEDDLSNDAQPETVIDNVRYLKP